MRVLGDFLNRSETRLYVRLNEVLNVLSDKLVDGNFVGCGWFFGGEVEDDSEDNKRNTI